MKQKQTKQHGRSMIEMLAVLAIVGVLSITALVGFTYAMNKHRANETIYDVMLRGTNVPMVDENYASKPAGHQFVFRDLPAGTYYPMTTKKDAGSSYYVEAMGVTYRVCELILKMNPTDIDQIVVNNSVYTGDSDICGTTDGLAMKFCFGSDGTICDGTGQGGSSGGSGSGSSGGSGSGSGTEPDACDGIDCGSYGVCNNGVCDCRDGYSGIDCSMPPECTTDADCSGNEACTDYTCGCPTGTTWNDVAQLCCGAPAQEDPSLCLTEYREASVGQCPGYVSACEDDQACTDGVCCPAFCSSDCSLPEVPECGTGQCRLDNAEPTIKNGRCFCSYTCPPAGGCSVEEQLCSVSGDDDADAVKSGWCCPKETTCGTTEGSCCKDGVCCSNGEMPYVNSYDASGNPSGSTCCYSDYEVTYTTLNGKTWEYCCPEGQVHGCTGGFNANGTCTESRGTGCYAPEKVFTMNHNGVDYTVGCYNASAESHDRMIAYCTYVNADGSCYNASCVDPNYQRIITKTIDGIEYTTYTGLGSLYAGEVGVCNSYHDNGRCIGITSCDLNSSSYVATIEINGLTYEKCLPDNQMLYCVDYYDNGNCRTLGGK